MLTLRTIFGAAWSISSRLGTRLIDFVMLIVLARALTPADFGLTAIALSLISIVEMVLEVPLIQALTRLRDVEKAHLHTAFTLGLIRGLVFSAAILIAAWPFAMAYKDGRLVLLIAALAIAPVARGLFSPGMVTFIRKMSFREIFIIQVAGKITASTIAIAVLMMGGGYWAIAVNNIASAVVATLLSYIIAPYRPGFSLSRFRDFSEFMGWFSLSQLLAAVNWQLDRIILGQTITKSSLGEYTMASDVASLPSQSLIGPAMQPVMAAFSKINDDPIRLRSAFLKASRFVMLISVPVYVAMATLAQLIVDLLFNDKWAGSSAYLVGLAIAFMPNTYYQPLSCLFLATNRPKRITEMMTIDFVIRTILVPLGIYFYSIWGVIVARGIGGFIMFGVAMIYARNNIGVSVVAQLRNLSEVAAASAAMALSMTMLAHYLQTLGLGALFQIPLIGATGTLVFVMSLLGLGVRPKTLLTGASS